MTPRYLDFNTWLRSRFGCRVQKITVDAGLTCPNRDGTLGERGCIYCNERGSGTGAFSKGLTVTGQLEQAKVRLEKRYKAKAFLAYFQAFTNTYAPVEKLAALWGEALAVPGVKGLCIGTRPDCVDNQRLDLMERFAKDSLVWAEYGLQSSRDQTLALINRGHDAACFADAVRRTQGRGIFTCAHVILGLPGETREDMLETARFIAKLGVDGVKIHLLYVVRNTGLERMWNAGQYDCMEPEAYVETVCDFLELLPPGMVIQRLTGDPHPEELAVPDWLLGSKSRILAAIRDRMEEHGMRQGRLFQADEATD